MHGFCTSFLLSTLPVVPALVIVQCVFGGPVEDADCAGKLPPCVDGRVSCEKLPRDHCQTQPDTKTLL
ncbi:hypothetical protein V496_05989 [Pseudogymnoascus sp. VKM F-4515 (FW-2607)]|nr:hypothetical protein V496_05989 [Pseudogymnoascus sp. VKM F-4515 (FW-2607)]